MKKILIVIILVFSFLLYERTQRTPSTSQPILSTAKKATVELFYIDNFDFWPSTPSAGPLTTVQFSWPKIHEEAGLILFKEENQTNNYLFIVDPTQKSVTIKNLFGHMDDHWNQAVNPVCVINGGFFEPGGTPSLPLIENGTVLPGQVTTQFPTRILYISQGYLTVADVTTNEDVQPSQWAISGIRPSFYNSDATVTNRTVVGVKDNLLYILITRDRTVDILVGIMEEQLGIDPSTIIALDSGYSSQVRCFGEDLLHSKSIMGSTIIISNP